MCICKASGDPHYETYDGSMIHFQGPCKYLLSKTIKETLPVCDFAIEVKNIRGSDITGDGSKDDVSYTRTVDATINGQLFRMEQEKKFKVTFKINVNSTTKNCLL